MKPVAVVRGAGDIATAIGRRLHWCGFSVVHLEIARPTVIRRAVAFASAVFEGRIAVEDVTAVLAHDVSEVEAILRVDHLAVLVDPDAASLGALRPVLLVDAILAKRNLGTTRDLAPCVVAVGPGFTAGVDAYAVVETCRGHTLGRVYLAGAALPDTGVPGKIAGVGESRVLRAPRGGVFLPRRAIGEILRSGDIVGEVTAEAVRTSIDGVLRGILYPSLTVHPGQKLGDVDPRGERESCFTISDKANAIAGGVLEAALRSEAIRPLVMAG